MKPVVEWRDLVACSPWETARELSLPLPWLALALWADTQGYWLLMALGAAFSFMLGLRIAHNAFHGNLGLSAGATDGVMAVLSVLMVGSMHAIDHTHRHHHAHCMAPDDIEGQIAHMGLGEAVLKSPAYPLFIHLSVMRNGSDRHKRWVVAELLAVSAWQCAVWCIPALHPVAHFSLLMLLANALAPLVGIWAVHRACESSAFNARTCRSCVLGRLTFGMFFHLEHHLYPAIPTCHLPELARRLDAAGFTNYLTVD